MSKRTLAAHEAAQREALLDALRRFVKRPPGLTSGDWDYDTLEAPRERRRLNCERKRALLLIDAIAARPYISATDIAKAFEECETGVEISLNNLNNLNLTPPIATLSYNRDRFPRLRYRAAVCATLQALWGADLLKRRFCLGA
jgi:hypothetical protein